MKYRISLLALLVVCVSCRKKDHDVTQAKGITGNWKLTEVLMDPGDGSGDYEAVSSSKTISFSADGLVTSNGSLCDMSVDPGTSTSGVYSAAQSVINPADCQQMEIAFELTGNTLVLSYPCIEPCRAKYVRVQ